MSVLWKTLVYSSILIKRMVRVTEKIIDGEQDAFGSDKESVDQILSLKQMREKKKNKNNFVFKFYSFTTGI